MKLLMSTVLVVLLLVQAGIALQCYRCEGDDLCANQVQCNGSCAKKHDYDQEDDTRRYCSEVREPEGSSKHVTGDSESVKTFFCNTNLCNGASPLGANRLAAAVPAFAMIVVAAVFRH